MLETYGGEPATGYVHTSGLTSVLLRSPAGDVSNWSVKSLHSRILRIINHFCPRPVAFFRTRFSRERFDTASAKAFLWRRVLCLWRRYSSIQFNCQRPFQRVSEKGRERRNEQPEDFSLVVESLCSSLKGEVQCLLEHFGRKNSIILTFIINKLCQVLIGLRRRFYFQCASYLSLLKKFI